MGKIFILIAICLLSTACVLEQGVISVKSRGIIEAARPISVAQVQLINNQIVVTGVNLDRVTEIKIKDGSTESALSVESKTATTLTANSLSDLRVAATKVADLIISSAEASATYTLDLGQWTVNGDNIYKETGYVGIGTNSPIYPLHVQQRATDPTASLAAARFSEYPVFNSAATNYSYALNADNYGTINNSSAIAGGLYGIQTSSTLAGTSTGSIDTLMGFRVTVGANAGATTAVNNLYGIYSRPLHYGGTYTNSYNLFLATAGTGGTATNEYALYQQSPVARNYFAGKVGINVTNATGIFDINGAKTGTGTISGTTTTVTGVGTLFSSELSVGDIIVVTGTGDERVITAIASDTSLTISKVFSTDPAGGAFTIKKKVGLGVGDVAIGGSLNTPIASGAGLFAGVSPKLEVLTGNNGWQGYGELFVLRHNSAINTANPRQLGMLMKLSSEASTGESAKTGGMILESTQTYANNPYLSLVTQNSRRLTVDFNGRVGIGTITPSYLFDVQGGDINASGNVRAAGVALTSDRRWKRNISLIPDAIKKLKQINGVSYDWAVDEYPEKHFSNQKQIGVIAQDVQAVFPELVLKDKDGYLSVNYPGLVAPLIEGFKEQEKQIEKNQELLQVMQGQYVSQSREIASLKKENAEMNSEIAQLKEAVCSLHPKLKICSK